MVKKRNQKIIRNSLIGLFIFVAIGLIFYFSTQQTFLFGSGIQLSENDEGLYQYAGDFPQSECKPDQRFKDYIISDTATINTASSEFKFVTTEVRQWMCSNLGRANNPNEPCTTSIITYAVDIFKDGKLIDEIKSIPNAQNFRDSNPPLDQSYYRAYSDEGEVFKPDEEHPRVKKVLPQRIQLPEGKTGINVIFADKSERRTPVRCQTFTVVHKYNLIYPKELISTEISSVKRFNGDVELELKIDNKVHTLEDDLSLFFVSGVGLPNEILNRKIDLAPNINIEKIKFEVEPHIESLRLYPKVRLFANTNRLSGLNGAAIFKDSKGIGDVRDHERYFIGEHTGNTEEVTIESIDKPVVIIDPLEEKTFLQKVEEIINGLDLLLIGLLVVIIGLMIWAGFLIFKK